MDFFEVIEKRRSIRKFKPESVPTEVINRAVHAALMAPNSSNMQPWEIHLVLDQKKEAVVKACLGQPAASTAAGLAVFVARRDTWRRNQKLMLAEVDKIPNVPKQLRDYYSKIVPFFYNQGPLSILGFAKRILTFFIGLARPMPRGPFSKGELLNKMARTVALGCENFMLAMTAQGYSTCPMEGFDECRLKKVMGLNSASTIVMVIGFGKEDPAGIYGERIRFDESLFVFKY